MAFNLKFTDFEAVLDSTFSAVILLLPLALQPLKALQTRVSGPDVS